MIFYLQYIALSEGVIAKRKEVYGYVHKCAYGKNAGQIAQVNEEIMLPETL